ncbi:MAG: NTP transferase domain-containing protein [Desulfovibrionaceae bacterium]|nr:NTP transferase domain-containing protein [Desulfovibrionaceae bacterium]
MLGIIIQARMTSMRLPGKVLRKVRGRPLLGRLLEGLAHCAGADLLVVATSDEASDDALAEFCGRAGVACHRGPLDDVAGRFLAAAGEYGLEAFVRVCADSPLLDYRLVDRAVELFRAGDWDVVTNALKRTFPKGQSVEVVRSAALELAHGRMDSAAEREHVTAHFYAHPDRYQILNFESGGDYGRMQMSVDTLEDLSALDRVLGLMTRPSWDYGWLELAELFRAASERPGRG